MLVAFRLAGLSALEGHYAGVKRRAQCEPTHRPRNKPIRQGGARFCRTSRRTGWRGWRHAAAWMGTALNFPVLGTPQPLCLRRNRPVALVRPLLPQLDQSLVQIGGKKQTIGRQ